MQKINPKSIRWESIKAVFRTVSDAEKISRAEIAQATSLSLMTVGKIADAMLAAGILRQSKETKNAAGRRAGVLSMKRDTYALVLDIAEHALSFSVTDTDLHYSREIPCPVNGNFTFEENLTLLFKQAREYIRAEEKKCIGVGIVLPAPLDEQSGCIRIEPTSRLYGIPLRDMVCSVFSPLPVCFDDAISAAAYSNIYDITKSDGNPILYCFAADGAVHGAITQNGQVLRGAHGCAGKLGQIVLSRGRTLASVIRDNNPLTENAAEIAKMVHNVILTIDPDTVILESELPGGSNIFIDSVRQVLTEQYGYTEDTLPTFVYNRCAYRHSHRGLLLRLREKHLYRTLLGEEAGEQ